METAFQAICDGWLYMVAENLVQGERIAVNLLNLIRGKIVVISLTEINLPPVLRSPGITYIKE